MSNDAHLIETFVSSQPIYQGKIVDVSIDTVQLPNGQQATREVVRHCGAVCVLAETPDHKVILVRQFRHPVNQVLLEAPAGKIDHPGDTPESCALRELAEETPYTAQSVKLLHHFYTAPGFCDELMYIFLAEGVEKNSALQADEDEFVDTVVLSKQEVREAMEQDRIQDAKTLVALYYWLGR